MYLTTLRLYWVYIKFYQTTDSFEAELSLLKRKLATEQVKYATEKDAHEALKEEYVQLEEKLTKEKESLERQLQSCREQLDTLQLRGIQGTNQICYSSHTLLNALSLCLSLHIRSTFSYCLTMHA